MKNYEKYADEIREKIGKNEGKDFCSEFIRPYILKSDSCGGYMTCDVCRMRQMIWLMEEYEEPGIDWSKVEVDTPILVRDDENAPWSKRHFAKYENGNVWAWRDALTSWTASDDDDVAWWNYAKFAESEEGGSRDETD